VIVSWPEVGPDTPSLGWAVVDLLENDLRVPTGSGAGRALRLSREQIQLIVAWYAVDDRGRFVWRRACWRLPKGWGKSPLAAAVAYAELVGPVVFDGFDASGQPVGRPHPSPWVQIAAVSEDQTDNTHVQLMEMLRDSPAVDDHRLEIGVTRIQFRSRPGRLEPVSASAGSREGQPLTAAILDETHLWQRTNGGRLLAQVLRRNVAKMGGRTVETTNAFAPGQRSVAEDTHEAVLSGRSAGVLYVAREAPPLDDLTDRGRLREALQVVYGDSSGWVDLDRIVEEISDPATEPSEARRFYLNQIVAPEEALVDLVAWSSLTDADGRLVEGDTIAIGFDGADTGDATAIVAVRWPDWLIVPIATWERPQGVTDWQTPRAEVDAVIRSTYSRYRVVRGYFDPPQWQSEIDGWAGEFGASVARWPHASDQRIGSAVERLSTMVREGTLRHNGDPTLIRHLANARREFARGGRFRPGRRHAGQPIDAASALCGALAALGDAMAHGEVRAGGEPPAMFVSLGDL
jgi:phage terminase large subunit-like protein